MRVLILDDMYNNYPSSYNGGALGEYHGCIVTMVFASVSGHLL